MKTEFLNMRDKLLIIDEIIRKEDTGNAKTLGQRLGVTERCIYNYLELLKELGANIKFDKLCNSYYYDNVGKLELNFVNNFRLD